MESAIKIVTSQSFPFKCDRQLQSTLMKTNIAMKKVNTLKSW